MQLYPHKIDSTLVRSFVARTTRLNTCVYLYFYNLLIIHQRRGHRYQSRNKHNLPSDPPTGWDPRELLIDRASNLLIKIPIAWTIPRPKDSLEEKPRRDQTNQIRLCHGLPIELPFALTNSRSISQENSRYTDRAHDWPIDIPIDLPIERDKKNSWAIKL